MINALQSQIILNVDREFYYLRIYQVIFQAYFRVILILIKHLNMAYANVFISILKINLIIVKLSHLCKVTQLLSRRLGNLIPDFCEPAVFCILKICISE